MSLDVLLGGVIGLAAAAMSFHEVDVRNPPLWDGCCCVIVVINHVCMGLSVHSQQIKRCNE